MVVYVHVIYYFVSFSIHLNRSADGICITCIITDKNHGLPDNLERIELCFSLPSKEELLRHLSLVIYSDGNL